MITTKLGPTTRGQLLASLLSDGPLEAMLRQLTSVYPDAKLFSRSALGMSEYGEPILFTPDFISSKMDDCKKLARIVGVNPKVPGEQGSYSRRFPGMFCGWIDYEGRFSLVSSTALPRLERIVYMTRKDPFVLDFVEDHDPMTHVQRLSKFLTEFADRGALLEQEF